MDLQRVYGYLTKTFQKQMNGGSIAYNVYGTDYGKNCLVLYVSAPFINKQTKDYHQNVKQVVVITKIFNELGYNVDVADYTIKRLRYKKKYDVVFDIQVKDINIYDSLLNRNASIIEYITGSNPVFSNKAEKKRIWELQQRKGVLLQPRRQTAPFPPRISDCDSVIFIGNQRNFKTYDNRNFKRVFFVRNTGYDFVKHIDYTKKRTNCFMFFGSTGSVHKGLDLLLDVFSEDGFPCKLYICGNYRGEKDFCRLYREELTNNNNIKSLGFVDIHSELFFKVCNRCSFMLLPSCSEGMAGAVTTCMSAGVVPIVSKMCGFDREDDVILLKDCRVDTIRKMVLDCSRMQPVEIKEKSETCLRHIREKFSMDCFYHDMKDAIIGSISPK